MGILRYEGTCHSGNFTTICFLNRKVGCFLFLQSLSEELKVNRIASDFQMKTGIGFALQLWISSLQEAQFTVLSNGMLCEGVKGGRMFQNRPHFASLARKGLRS